MYFKLICIDPYIASGKLPSGIESTPTLVVTGQNKILVGNDIYRWIEMIMEMRTKNLMMLQRQMIINNIKINNKENLNGPLAYIQSEMEGFSDNFGIINDVNDFGNKDQITQPKTFFSYGDEENNTIFTPQTQFKEKVIDINNQAKNAEALRNLEIEEIKKIQQNSQIDMLIQNEKRKLFS
jgi:hypothetical protein